MPKYVLLMKKSKECFFEGHEMFLIKFITVQRNKSFGCKTFSVYALIFTVFYAIFISGFDQNIFRWQYELLGFGVWQQFPTWISAAM